jgi:hypothetical protein
MRRSVLFFSLVMIGYSAQAQSRFTFGPSFGIGTTHFVGLGKATIPGIALSAAAVGEWQLKPWFAVAFSPGVAVYGGGLRMQESGSQAARNVSNSYRDMYSVYAVQFPLMLKCRAGRKRTHIYGAIGAGIEEPMGGTHSKRYDDPSINATRGFVGHSMNELRDSYSVLLFGAGIEYAFPKGVLSLDMRFDATNTLASIEGSAFKARAGMIGLAWRIKD